MLFSKLKKYKEETAWNTTTPTFKLVPVFVDVELPEGHHLRQEAAREVDEAIVLEIQQDYVNQLFPVLSVFVVGSRDLVHSEHKWR